MRACLDLRFKEAGALRLLCVASLTAKKDHANLLRALEGLDTTDLGPMWLGIVGDGPLRASVADLAGQVNEPVSRSPSSCWGGGTTSRSCWPTRMRWSSHRRARDCRSS